MHTHRPYLLAASLALALGSGIAGKAGAQETPISTAQMQALIEQQAAQIQALERRLSALEQQGAGAATPAVAAAPAPTVPLTGDAAIQAQVQAAIADSQSSDVALLQQQQAQVATGGGDRTSWRKGGPEFRSADRRFTFHPRGRVLADFSSTTGSDYDDRNLQGTEMRQVRLGAEGTMGDFRYKIDAELADNTVSIKDAFFGYETRVGGHPLELFVGNKLRDRSIEGATTLTRTPFMERNAVASIGSPDTGYFGLGVQARLYGNSWHWSAGVTGDDLGNSGDTSDSLVFSTRAHWNPIKRSRGFVHLGAWYTYEELGDDIDRINKVPRLVQHFNDNIRVSASAIDDTTRDDAFGVELGGVYRSVWGFGEYTRRSIDSSSEPGVEHVGTSLYGGWLLTGEKPGFSTRSGIWGTTRVLRPVGEGGAGAFELVARYDDYDFTDAARGGRGKGYTVGVNWYLNNWSRLMLNLMRWETDNQVGSYKGKDSGNAVGVRAQVVF